MSRARAPSAVSSRTLRATCRQTRPRHPRNLRGPVAFDQSLSTLCACDGRTSMIRMGSSQADAAATVRGGRTLRSASGVLAWSGACVAQVLSLVSSQALAIAFALCACRRDIGKFAPAELTDGFGSISDMQEAQRHVVMVRRMRNVLDAEIGPDAYYCGMRRCAALLSPERIRLRSSPIGF